MSSNKKYVPPNKRNGNGNVNNKKNRLTTRKEPITQIDFSKESFPELGNKNINNTKDESQTDFFYSSALAKPKEVESTNTVDNEVPPGWVQLSYDKNRKIKYEYNKHYNLLKEQEQEQEQITFQEEASVVFSNMIRRWNNYKKFYNSLYGEGAYEKIYEMGGSYQDDKYSDDTNGEDEQSQDDDEDEYDNWVD
jgi:hypothetical protein